MSVSRTSRFVAAAVGAVFALWSAAAAAQGAVTTLSLDSDMDPAAAGALDPAGARLPADLWRGADRAEIARLAANLPRRPSSPALRDLVRRTLAVAAMPPKGASVSPGLIETRARALLRMGDAELAARLMAAMPKTKRDLAADALLLDASLLTLDHSSACAVARSRTGQAADMVFSKASAFCEALAGDRDRADFVAALVYERASDDKAFFALLDGMAAGKVNAKRAFVGVDAPSPLHFAMLRALGAPPPDPKAERADDYGPAAERLIATDPAATLRGRMVAMWGALQANRADFEAARQLFMAAGDSKAAPKGAAGKVARLYARTVAAPRGPDRTTALGRLLKAGDDLDAGVAVAKLAQPLLVDVLALASRPDIAGRIARGLLLAEEHRAARRWLVSLRAAAKVPGAEDAGVRLTELYALVDAADERPFVDTEAAVWLGAAGRVKGRDAGEMAAIMAKCRGAVGLDVPKALATAAAAWSPKQPLSPLEVLPMQSAAEAGRVGEAVLRAAHLVDGQEAASRPYRLAEAAAALAAAGLAADARRLAVEAAIAGGL